jgi:micrococcal nuclease
MRLQYKNALKSYIGFFIIILVTFVSCNKNNEVTENTATIVKIIDGDTYKINYNGKTESVRLIGIDTPESRANQKAKRDAKKSGESLKQITALGKQATQYVKSIINPGDEVKIELDVQERDKYGRILGYVYLKNGTLLNEKIIRDGYAQVMTVPPNVKYQEKFLAAQQEARNNNRGLWKEEF